MDESEELEWHDKLKNTFFPVQLSDVMTGTPARRAKRFRAIVPVHENDTGEPFAVVTEKYKLIRNEEAVDLGCQAAELIFGPQFSERMSVFNVVMARKKGSFFADFTAPSERFQISIPQFDNSNASNIEYHKQHTYFLRVMNSYNKTLPIKLEIGVCRWMCRNGIIFDKHSIVFKNPHSKPAHRLFDQIVDQENQTNFRKIASIPSLISNAYQIQLASDMCVLEGVCQTLKLSIPRVDASSRTAKLWNDRCGSLARICRHYHEHAGSSAYSVIQAASEWAQHRAGTSPIQRDSYERRCGEMIETLSRTRRWPDRAADIALQVNRILDWSSIFSNEWNISS